MSHSTPGTLEDRYIATLYVHCGYIGFCIIIILCLLLLLATCVHVQVQCSTFMYLTHFMRVYTMIEYLYRYGMWSLCTDALWICSSSINMHVHVHVCVVWSCNCTVSEVFHQRSRSMILLWFFFFFVHLSYHRRSTTWLTSAFYPLVRSTLPSGMSLMVRKALMTLDHGYTTFRCTNPTLSNIT